jgi:dUTPase
MINIFCNKALKKLLKDKEITHYTPAYEGESAGIDLYNCGDDVILKPIETFDSENTTATTSIKTGVHLIVPKGYVALVKERGSIVKNTLKSRAGVIDAGYTGEVFVNLVNLSNKTKKIMYGEKLPVQIVVVKCDNHFNTIDEEEYLKLSDESLRKKGKVGSSD